MLPFAKLIAGDLLGRRDGQPPEVHLEAAIDWLTRAHDRSPDDGVSYGYSLLGGWRPSYVETSGYIAITFFDLAARGRPGYRDRALSIIRWLCSVQNRDGSFSNPRLDPDCGIVFDTGQDLLGLVRAWAEEGPEPFAEAARRAGDWLVAIADPEGRWTRNTHNGIPHVYNTRVAWALLALDRRDPAPDRERVARANLDWALTQERNGWFEQCAFETGVAPFTHTIAYAIRGLLEAGLLLDDSRYLEAARRSAEAVILHLGSDGFIPGQIDARGRAAASYCCLTGSCQLAVVWAKLAKLTGEAGLRDAALAALRYVMARQNTTAADPDVRGAIKGSHPVWGRYSRFTFPAWATKFFIDAMLECEEWL